MVIDIIVILLLVLAIYKGYKKGLVIAFFSILAFVLGIAAAMKLSVVVASYLGRTVHITGQWLPVISFIVVFVVVVLLVRLGASLIEKTLKLALLGWANRIFGILLYAILYMLLLSVLLFYAEQVRLVSAKTLAGSRTWTYIQPLGPWAMNGLGKLVPFFRDMFDALESFFDNISRKVS
jgi:membrane protein required for colicin V production